MKLAGPFTSTRHASPVNRERRLTLDARADNAAQLNVSQPAREEGEQAFPCDCARRHTLNIKSALTQWPAYQGLVWGLSGDPQNDFPLTSAGSFGHNEAFGAIIWIDPKKKLLRIFPDHRLRFGNESNLFMVMAGAVLTD